MWSGNCKNKFGELRDWRFKGIQRAEKSMAPRSLGGCSRISSSEHTPLEKGYRLLTADAGVYQASFPKLVLVIV